MTVDRHFTIDGETESTLRERASRFIAIAFHAPDEAALKERLERCAKDHHAARHFCFAHVLGPMGETHRANDDGEPTGTAGKPILRAIQGKDLTDTAVIVIRYFGGTLLGKGGLVRAYGDAARLALTDAKIIEVVMRDQVRVLCDHAHFDIVKKDLVVRNGELVHCDFGLNVEAVVALPRSSVDEVTSRWRVLGIAVNGT